jgi:hypothetical protein
MSYDPYDQFGYGLRMKLENIQSQLMKTGDISRSIHDRLEEFSGIRDILVSSTNYASQVSEAYEAVKRQDQIYQLKAAAGFGEDSVQEIIRRQAELDKSARRLVGFDAETYLVKQRFLESLESTGALLKYGSLKGDLLALARQPQLAFQKFYGQQIELAATASEVVKNNRLMLIEAASTLLTGMNSGLEFGLLMYPAHDPPRVVSGPAVREPRATPVPGLALPNEVNVLAELASDFESLDLIGVDVESVIFGTRPAQVIRLGEQLLSRVYDLNIRAERGQKPSIFKPTSKLYLVCKITTRVATDERSFGEIVDLLYFLLYEGSGYAARLKDLCSDDDLAALWRLKHLRTGIRHDVDHGSEREIAKNNEKIGKAYKSLTGNVMPRSRAEWAAAQIMLYKQLIEMLEVIWITDERGDVS